MAPGARDGHTAGLKAEGGCLLAGFKRLILCHSCNGTHDRLEELSREIGPSYNGFAERGGISKCQV